MKFTVLRETWDRGVPSRCKLLTDDGKMCCLGFLAKELGASDEEIRNVGFPATSPTVAWPAGLLRRDPIGGKDSMDCYFNSNTELCHEITRTNDGADSDLVRESRLTELFSSIGIEVEFK